MWKWERVAFVAREVRWVLKCAGGDNAGKDDLDVGAGEQDIQFDYTSDETHSMTVRLERN